MLKCQEHYKKFYSVKFSLNLCAVPKCRNISLPDNFPSQDKTGCYSSEDTQTSSVSLLIFCIDVCQLPPKCVAGHVRGGVTHFCNLR